MYIERLNFFFYSANCPGSIIFGSLVNGSPAFLMELGKATLISLAVMKLTQLHPEQEKAIRAFLSGKYIFVSLPTGYGKSIIYLLLFLIFDRMRGM